MTSGPAAGPDTYPGGTSSVGTATSPPALGTGRLESLSTGPFELESGIALEDLTVAYRHDGPGPADAPQVLAIHALTGTDRRSSAYSKDEPDDRSPIQP